jgi:hypothetical protein
MQDGAQLNAILYLLDGNVQRPSVSEEVTQQDLLESM